MSMISYREAAGKLKEYLGLRWEPVAVRLLRPGEEVPDGLIEPNMPLRHCQSILMARRGHCLVMPAGCHACPDGAGIMGITEMPPKLRSGELYLLFKKLPDMETVQKMLGTRAEFEAGSYEATLLAPLGSADFEPDVIIFTLWPEQAMWLCCAQTYSTGQRQDFQTSGFNSTCCDLVVKPMQNGGTNISFGCYGARASGDIDDFELYYSIPPALLDDIVKGLGKLSEKSIPESRRKIYLPPVFDKVGRKSVSQEEEPSVTINIDAARCRSCGLCVAFCPNNVLEMRETGGKQASVAAYPENCSVCYTCVGQCPEQIIQIV